MDNTYPYIASLTREPFLFYEMRTTAKLLSSGMSNNDVVTQITSDNLFQYPTEKSVARMAKACLKRLAAMDDNDLVRAIAQQPTDVAKQICLYAMMKQSRLMWEFMLTVMRLQEQDDAVATWSEGTITKLKQVLAKVLVENEYLDDIRADHLNPVYLHPILENAIRCHGDLMVLPAFNCFS